MSRRSPARFLAPLALLAAIAVVYLVVHTGLDNSAGDTSSAGATTGVTSTSKRKKKATSTTAHRTPKPARVYVVKPGDVLGSIATKTKVSVDDLLSINGLDAATPLRVGQKLKLAP